MGLLPVATRFLPGEINPSSSRARLAGFGLLAKAQNAVITGYEIHMGQTEGQGVSQPFLIEQRSQKICSDGDGTLSADGNVVGTYIHGLFHNHELRRAILIPRTRQTKRADARRERRDIFR